MTQNNKTNQQEKSQKTPTADAKGDNPPEELKPSQVWEGEKGNLTQRLQGLKKAQAELIGREQLIKQELEQVENEIRQHTFAMQAGDFVSKIYEDSIEKEDK